VPDSFARFLDRRGHEWFVHEARLRLAAVRGNFEVPHVHTGARGKEALYHQLAQLLESGHPLRNALELIATQASHGTQRWIARGLANLRQGATASEAMAPGSSPLEVALIAAGERAGRLPQSFAELSRHFGRRANLQRDVIRGCLYPIFIMHVAAILLPLPKLITTGAASYATAVGITLGSFFGAILLIVAVGIGLINTARRSALIDRLLMTLPVIGKMRRDFALARFFSVFEMHLSAGSNILETLNSAGETSQSAVIGAASQRALEAARRGDAPLPVLLQERAFRSAAQFLLVGEQTGRLDLELDRLRNAMESSAAAYAQLLGQMLSRILYAAVVIYSAIQIVRTYSGVLDIYKQLLDL
jgi:type II secretory pathway component PulF